MTNIGPIAVSATFSGQVYVLGVTKGEHATPEEAMRATARLCRDAAQKLDESAQDPPRE